MDRKKLFFVSIKKNIRIQEFIDSLNVNIPSKETFLQLSRVCPINPLVDEPNSNFERGMLLYALIIKYKPKNVLEIGTAEGFSTLCMAWAMTDCGINGKIFTIDPKQFDIPVERLNTWDETQENKIVMLSTKEIWEKFGKKNWLEKIKIYTGSSGEILNKFSNELPKMDMAYIDGHHVFNAVNHDFHAFLRIASKNFCILFDDYFKNGDVAKVVDEQIIPNFDVSIIKTDAFMQKSKDTQLEENNMCFIESDSLKNSLEDIFPKSKSKKIIEQYIAWEKRWKLRKSLNQKIPFLGKIKFNR